MSDDNIRILQDKSEQALEKSTVQMLEEIRERKLTGYSCARSYSDGSVNVVYLGCHAKNKLYAIGATMLLVYRLLKAACR